MSKERKGLPPNRQPGGNAVHTLKPGHKFTPPAAFDARPLSEKYLQTAPQIAGDRRLGANAFHSLKPGHKFTPPPVFDARAISKRTAPQTAEDRRREALAIKARIEERMRAHDAEMERIRETSTLEGRIACARRLKAKYG